MKCRTLVVSYSNGIIQCSIKPLALTDLTDEIHSVSIERDHLELNEEELTNGMS